MNQVEGLCHRFLKKDTRFRPDRVRRTGMKRTTVGKFSRMPDAQSLQGFREFRSKVLEWATPDNLRDFPWRRSKEPFKLLISELMLRRTQARQVTAVYTEFFCRWPDLTSFVTATDEALLQVLRPLGLAWRVQNILEVRRALRNMREVPSDYSGLLSLPGVGDYVASAVLCFSYKEIRPLIDTNTVRLIGRYFGMTTHPGTRRLKSFRNLASKLVPGDVANAARYHYGLLDLAATVCRPVRPQCPRCALKAHCLTGNLEGTSLAFEKT